MEQLCISCNEAIHPGRLKALPGTKVCVECSTTGRKKAVTILGGEGEDTFNDIVIMEENDYNEYIKDDLRKNTLD